MKTKQIKTLKPAKSAKPTKPPVKPEQKEFERIVEFSFNPKQSKFVVRFLSGETYTLKVEDLPKKLQTRKPKWAETKLSDDQGSLLFKAHGAKREIPAYIIHSKGKPLQ